MKNKIYRNLRQTHNCIVRLKSLKFGRLEEVVICSYFPTYEALLSIGSLDHENIVDVFETTGLLEHTKNSNRCSYFHVHLKN